MLRSMWCVTMLGNMFELNKFEFEINSTSETGYWASRGKIRLVKTMFPNLFQFMASSLSYVDIRVPHDGQDQGIVIKCSIPVPPQDTSLQMYCSKDNVPICGLYSIFF